MMMSLVEKIVNSPLLHLFSTFFSTAWYDTNSYVAKVYGGKLLVVTAHII